MKTYFSIKGIFNPTSHTEPESAPLTPRDMLLADIQKTQCALEIAYSGFDNVTDPDLIDCYIYEVNSALKRYRFLLQTSHPVSTMRQCWSTPYTLYPLAIPLFKRLSLMSVFP